MLCHSYSDRSLYFFFLFCVTSVVWVICANVLTRKDKTQGVMCRTKTWTNHQRRVLKLITRKLLLHLHLADSNNHAKRPRSYQNHLSNSFSAISPLLIDFAVLFEFNKHNVSRNCVGSSRNFIIKNSLFGCKSNSTLTWNRNDFIDKWRIL